MHDELDEIVVVEDFMLVVEVEIFSWYIVNVLVGQVTYPVAVLQVPLNV